MFKASSCFDFFYNPDILTKTKPALKHAVNTYKGVESHSVGREIRDHKITKLDELLLRRYAKASRNKVNRLVVR